MAYVPSDYPLYYDATNEKGLSIAALNFPKEVYYQTFQDNKYNITPFEFIPWILGQCASLKDVRNLLEHTSLLCENYSHDLPLSPLHWFIADQNGSLVVEPRKSGLKVYENPVGVLTNNPPFPMQMFQLNQYMHL